MKITKKEIRENIRTEKIRNGWLHDYTTEKDNTFWYCHINSFDGSQVVFAQNEYGEAHNLLENKKSAFVNFLYELENEK